MLFLGSSQATADLQLLRLTQLVVVLGHGSSPWFASMCCRSDLLGAPASIRISHIRRRLNRGNVFEDDVADTNNANDGSGHVLVPAPTDNCRTNEDVDCSVISEVPEGTFLRPFITYKRRVQ